MNERGRFSLRKATFSSLGESSSDVPHHITGVLNAWLPGQEDNHGHSDKVGCRRQTYGVYPSASKPS